MMSARLTLMIPLGIMNPSLGWVSRVNSPYPGTSIAADMNMRFLYSK